MDVGKCEWPRNCHLFLDKRVVVLYMQLTQLSELGERHLHVELSVCHEVCHQVGAAQCAIKSQHLQIAIKSQHLQIAKQRQHNHLSVQL